MVGILEETRNLSDEIMALTVKVEEGEISEKLRAALTDSLSKTVQRLHEEVTRQIQTKYQFKESEYGPKYGYIYNLADSIHENDKDIEELE